MDRKQRRTAEGLTIKEHKGILESDRIIPYFNVLKSDKIAF